MENKTIPYEDIRNQFASFLKTLDEIPFKFFFDNEKICPDKFAALFNYLVPTLPILSYVTMLKTENPDVTIPKHNNLVYRNIYYNVRTLEFNSWVGYYTEMDTSFNADFIIENNSIKNYCLMYKYLKVLKTCVLIIDDFFLMLDTPKNCFTPIYKDISSKTISILSKLVGFYGNYILAKSGHMGQYPADDMLYVFNPTVDRNNIVYNPFVVENANFPITADLTLARGGEGTNFLETIPRTRLNNVEARIVAEIIEGEIDRPLRDNAHRTATECMELLRAAT